MPYHVRDYHAALETLQGNPITLTERDFDILLDFGGPEAERRGRAAQSQAQLAVTTKAEAPPAPAEDQGAARLTQIKQTQLRMALLSDEGRRWVLYRLAYEERHIRENVRRVATQMLAAGEPESLVATFVDAALTDLLADALGDQQRTLIDRWNQWAAGR